MQDLLGINYHYQLADAQGKSVEAIKAIITSLHEFNPMMGHRGLRLAVTYPEIAKMQTKAVIRAAINVKKAHADWNIVPEIMIPLASETKELKYVKDIVVEVAEAVKALAKAEGYVYIIDKQAAQGTYIFLNDTLNEDVTNKVAAKLGITLAPAAPTRPVATK